MKGPRLLCFLLAGVPPVIWESSLFRSGLHRKFCLPSLKPESTSSALPLDPFKDTLTFLCLCLRSSSLSAYLV